MKIIILFLCVCLFSLGAAALFDPGPVEQCYQCKKEHCNSACTNIEECKDKETVCETTVTWKGSNYEVSKGCKKPKANPQTGCIQKGKKTTCRYLCITKLCNGSLPPKPVNTKK